MRSNNASYSVFYVLLIICAAALHADASQEDQLRKFIRSRRDRRNDKSTLFRVNKQLGDRVASSLLSTSYSNSEQSALRAADKITALPGQPAGVDFDQYSGYVTVDEKNGRALFYYFVEAPQDASTKPLLLWLSGGPACSSLGLGAMQELIGPFRVNSDNKTLSRNKNAWNNVANVIFLESPAGVGFSYSNTSSDYDLNGDQRTADDAYLFLVNWLERFPEYKRRPFYISGENYAGHYAPELAATILIHNSYNSKTIINLRGILVGNPVLDWNIHFIKGQVDYLWSHGMISDEVFANVTRHCQFDDSDGVECSGALDAMDADVGDINHFNAYAPFCVNAANGAYYPNGHLPGEYDPCSYHYTYAYLNDPAVQTAFHARMTSWSDCGNFNWADAPISMVPTISWLVQKKLPVWIFSGDFDAACPLHATRYSIQDLNLRITTPWRPWTVNMEVGGYVQQYKGGFTFSTVRGAGHMVAASQPERALVLLDSFFKGVLPLYVME